MKVDPNGLELLAKTAVSDVSFFLRTSHLKKLAAILDDPEKVELLSRGETVENIDFETLPIEKRLQSGLTDCKDILGSLVSALEATPPSSDIAENYTQLARQVNNLANSVAKKLLSIQTSELE